MRPPSRCLIRPRCTGLPLAAALAAASACVAREPPPDPATFTLVAPAGPSASDGLGADAPTTAQPALVPLAADYTSAVLARADAKAMAVIAGTDATLCLDVPTTPLAAGAKAMVFRCLGPDKGDQSWVLDQGRLIIGGTFCLAPDSGSGASLSPVLAACVADQAAAGQANQLWSYAGGTLSLAGGATCLSRGQDDSGVAPPLRLEPCAAGSTLQQWSLANIVAAAGSDPIVVGAAARLRRSPTFCLDVLDGAEAAGAVVGVLNCGSVASQPVLMQQSRLQYRDKCLGVAGGKAIAGAGIETQACGAGGAQAWRLDEGLLQLVGDTASPGLCLCVPAGAPKDQVSVPLQLLLCRAAEAPNPDCLWSWGSLAP